MFCSKAHLIYIKDNYLKGNYVCYFEMYFTTYFISFSVSLALLAHCSVSSPHLISAAFVSGFACFLFTFILFVVFWGKIKIKNLYTIKFGVIPV